MTLNPITALSEQLQKLINEHGSASILRDHLALFKDQVVLLEKKTMLLESENTILKTKIEQLTKDNDELRGKIQQHNTVTQEFERKTANNGVVYLCHKTEPNVFACANCSSHDHPFYLLPDPSPSSGYVSVYFCDKCRKSITIDKAL